MTTTDRKTPTRNELRERVKQNAEAVASWPDWLRASVSTSSIFPARSSGKKPGKQP